MPQFHIIATGYHNAGVRMDLFRTDADGNMQPITAPDAETARSTVIDWLRDNLGGTDFNLLHLDIIPVEGG